MQGQNMGIKPSTEVAVNLKNLSTLTPADLYSFRVPLTIRMTITRETFLSGIFRIYIR
jgi:hypothetical protein